MFITNSPSSNYLNLMYLSTNETCYLIAWNNNKNNNNNKNKKTNCFLHYFFICLIKIFGQNNY